MEVEAGFPAVSEVAPDHSAVPRRRVGGIRRWTTRHQPQWAGTGSLLGEPHFTNFLLVLSRQRLFAGAAAAGGHLMNLPLASRHCLASTPPAASRTAMAAAIESI